MLGFGSVTSDNLHDRCRTPKEVSCNTFVDLFFSCSSLVVDDPQLPGNFFSPSGSKKKFGVYVKNEKGNVVKVNFGDPNMKIKKSDPARRKSFRARHN